MIAFTAKQRAILDLITQGYTNREIGRFVGNTENVIKNKLRVLFDETGCFTRLELALWTLRAKDLGMIQ